MMRKTLRPLAIVALLAAGSWSVTAAAQGNPWPSSVLALSSLLAATVVALLAWRRETAARRAAERSLQSARTQLEVLRSTASLADASAKEVCDHILASLTKLTESAYGFYGFVDADESAMTIYSWSGDAMRDCAMVDKPAHFRIAEAGVWGEAIRRRAPLLLNDYAAGHPAKKGLPAGHVRLTNLMVVPSFSGGRIAAVAAVANRARDYSREDVAQVTTFLNSIQGFAGSKRAEEQLSEANQIMAGILEHTHMMAVLLDARFNFVWVNRSYAETCRHPASFFPGKNHFALYPHEENRAIFQRVVDTGEPYVVAAKPFTFPDQPERGVTHWDWSLIPIKDARGRVSHLVFTLLEVTERCASEVALRRTTEVLEARVRELLCLYGLSRLLEQPDLPLEALFRGAIETLDAAWRRRDVLRTRITYERETWGAARPLAARGGMSADIRVGGARAGMIDVVVDETHADADDAFTEEERRLLGAVADWVGRTLEHRLARERLIGTLEELERSNKDLEQFAYVASHDLQEPLRMVTSYVQLLERHHGSKLDAEAREFIAFAVQGARRMQSLIRDLLSYSRAGRGELARERCNLADVIREVLLDMRMTIAESGAAVTHDALPAITADPLMLRQLFQNLISNALKFRAERPPVVRIAAEDRGSEWVFSVRDNGIGIEAKHADRLFKIFQRLHTQDKYSGTGIGLALCKKIVQRHGGRIWFDSTPGEGATFFFALPRERAPRPQPDTTADQPACAR